MFLVLTYSAMFKGDESNFLIMNLKIGSLFWDEIIMKIKLDKENLYMHDSV